jgi:hypothetical protein
MTLGLIGLVGMNLGSPWDLAADVFKGEVTRAAHARTI